MRDKNPIDDLFKEALYSASVEPPAHLAEVVLGAARRKRRAGLWYQRRSVWILLFVLLGTGAAYEALHLYTKRSSRAGHSISGSQAPSKAGRTITPSATPDNTEPESATTAEMEVDQDAGAKQRSMASSVSRVLPMDVPPSERTVPLDGRGTSQDQGTGSVKGEADARSEDLYGALLAPDNGSSYEGDFIGESMEASTSLLLPLVHEWNTPPNATLLPGRPVDHRTAGSELWVGINAAPYASHYLWSGGAGELNEAMNKAEAWTSTIGVGAMLGRTWRSGGELAIGLEHERSEQAYYHRATVIEQERSVETQMVVLNSTVYYSNTDTVITERPTQRVSEGRDQRATWRIPIEGAWRTAVGRFVFGARAGIAAEFTRAVSASSLTFDEMQGSIISASLDRSSIARRYPVNAVGIVGAELGFVLHEHWTVCATPLYMRGLFNISEGGALRASPERTGIRFQLRYTFR